MTDIAKADIFFIVTTVAVGLVSVALLVALMYLIRILRNASKLSQSVREEGEEIVRDVKIARERAENQGVRFAQTVSSFFSKGDKNTT